MKRIREQLFAARRAMTAGHLDAAERAYRSVLSIEPTDEAALEGLVDIERLRRIETDGVSSTDWQQQYAAGADESIDLPPMLSSDIFETLSTDDTEPPSIPVEAQTVASSAAVLDTAAEPEANQDAYHSIQHVAAADETGGREPENPVDDPYLMSQAIFSVSESQDGFEEWASAPSFAPSDPSKSALLPKPERVIEASQVVSNAGDWTMDSDVEVSASIISEGGRHRQTIDEDCEDADDGLAAMIQLADSRYRAGDHEGAIAACLGVLQLSPGHPIASSLKESSERQLKDAPQRRVRQLHLRPRLQLSQNEVQWQVTTPQESFLLSLIDGRTSIEDIIDISTMPRDEVLEMLVRLVEQGLVSLPN